MAEKRMVEVRFDCGLHDMKEEQALALLRGLANYYPIVGLAFDNKAGVILTVDENLTASSTEAAVNLAESAGLTVACTQAMTLEEYEAAAWGEADLNG